MKKLLIAALLATGSVAAAEQPSKVGIVNFANCITDSKYGKNEQAQFETTRKQMASLIEDTEKQLREISEKFNDKDFLDGLSPEAEDQLKTKFRTLNEELSRYQQQFYSVMNQSQMKLIQAMQGHINEASEKVASSKNLTMVVNKELCFFHLPSLDVTSDVIKEMDKNFDTVQPSAQEKK